MAAQAFWRPPIVDLFRPFRPFSSTIRRWRTWRIAIGPMAAALIGRSWRLAVLCCWFDRCSLLTASFTLGLSGRHAAQPYVGIAGASRSTAAGLTSPLGLVCCVPMVNLLESPPPAFAPAVAGAPGGPSFFRYSAIH